MKENNKPWFKTLWFYITSSIVSVLLLVLIIVLVVVGVSIDKDNKEDKVISDDPIDNIENIININGDKALIKRSLDLSTFNYDSIEEVEETNYLLSKPRKYIDASGIINLALFITDESENEELNNAAKGDNLYKLELALYGEDTYVDLIGINDYYTEVTGVISKEDITTTEKFSIEGSIFFNEDYDLLLGTTTFGVKNYNNKHISKNLVGNEFIETESIDRYIDQVVINPLGQVEIEVTDNFNESNYDDSNNLVVSEPITKTWLSWDIDGNNGYREDPYNAYYNYFFKEASEFIEFHFN